MIVDDSFERETIINNHASFDQASRKWGGERQSVIVMSVTIPLNKVARVTKKWKEKCNFVAAKWMRFYY